MCPPRLHACMHAMPLAFYPLSPGVPVQNPPFLYGTHYSCPGYVMYWLVRAAPAHLLRCSMQLLPGPLGSLQGCHTPASQPVCVCEACAL